MANRPIDPRLRYLLVLPGLPQWCWGQRGCGLVYLGWYASSVVGGLLCWGTTMGAILLGFGVLVHLASAVDVLRQSSFPGWTRRVSWTWALMALGLGCYTPAFFVGAVSAWPVAGLDGSRSGLLVNRWAYQKDGPAVGDRVWVSGQGPIGPGPAIVLAVSGQTMERRDDDFRFHSGRDLSLIGQEGRAVEMEVRVPVGHLLVAFEPGDGQTDEPIRLTIVARSSVLGRVWAELPLGPWRGPRSGRWDFDPRPWTSRTREV